MRSAFRRFFLAGALSAAGGFPLGFPRPTLLLRAFLNVALFFFAIF